MPPKGKIRQKKSRGFPGRKSGKKESADLSEDLFAIFDNSGGEVFDEHEVIDMLDFEKVPKIYHVTDREMRIIAHAIKHLTRSFDNFDSFPEHVESRGSYHLALSEKASAYMRCVDTARDSDDRTNKVGGQAEVYLSGYTLALSDPSDLSPDRLWMEKHPLVARKVLPPSNERDRVYMDLCEKHGAVPVAGQSDSGGAYSRSFWRSLALAQAANEVYNECPTFSLTHLFDIRNKTIFMSRLLPLLDTELADNPDMRMAISYIYSKLPFYHGDILGRSGIKLDNFMYYTIKNKGTPYKVRGVDGPMFPIVHEGKEATTGAPYILQAVPVIIDYGSSISPLLFAGDSAQSSATLSAETQKLADWVYEKEGLLEMLAKPERTDLEAIPVAESEMVMAKNIILNVAHGNDESYTSLFNQEFPLGKQIQEHFFPLPTLDPSSTEDRIVHTTPDLASDDGRLFVYGIPPGTKISVKSVSEEENIDYVYHVVLRDGKIENDLTHILQLAASSSGETTGEKRPMLTVQFQARKDYVPHTFTILIGWNSFSIEPLE